MKPKGLNLFDDEPILIRQCALASLYQRLGIGGILPSHLSPTGIHELTELEIRYMPERRVQIPVVEGKINAFLSKEYSIIDTTEVFEIFDRGVRKLAGDTENFYGAWSYETTMGRYTLPIRKTINNTDYGVIAGLTTSDNGMSVIHIDGFLKDKREIIPLFTSVSIEHKGASNIKDVEENIKILESAINAGMTNLGRMIMITIDNPVGYAKRVAEKCCLKKCLLFRQSKATLNHLKLRLMSISCLQEYHQK